MKRTIDQMLEGIQAKPGTARAGTLRQLKVEWELVRIVMLGEDPPLEHWRRLVLKAGANVTDCPNDNLDEVRNYLMKKVQIAESGREPFERDPVEAERIRPVAACASVLRSLSPHERFDAQAGHEPGGSEPTVLCDPRLEIKAFSTVLSWIAQKAHFDRMDPSRAGFRTHTPTAERVIVDAARKELGGGEVLLVDPDVLPRFGELPISIKVQPSGGGRSGCFSFSIFVARCPADGPLSPFHLIRLADMYHADRSKFETSFHNIVPQQHDPYTRARVAAEWGWSTFPGKNKQQKEAFANNESYKLANSDTNRKSSEGARFYDMWIKDKIVPLWQELVRAFPEECAHMLSHVPVQYRLEGTGFTKVTVGENNPTPMHVDNNNFGLTALLGEMITPTRPKVKTTNLNHTGVIACVALLSH